VQIVVVSIAVLFLLLLMLVFPQLRELLVIPPLIPLAIPYLLLLELLLLRQRLTMMLLMQQLGLTTVVNQSHFIFAAVR
jgi:hypothetical protein